jgi:Sensors of blue-light using FAD
MNMTPVEPSALISLVYRSTASRPLAKRDLEHILDSARKRNLEEQVTGLLLFTDGKFIQYLEGPQIGVLKIFDIIKNSSLHGEITEVSRQSVDCREYGDWSMAFLADIDAHLLPGSGNDAQLIHTLEAETSDASSAGKTQLAEFWNKPTAAKPGK